jgi:hypothetical protein
VAKVMAAFFAVFCGTAYAGVDVVPFFGFGDNVRDVISSYFEVGLGGWYRGDYFYNHLYLGYQKEYGIMEEYTVEHGSAYRIGDTAVYIFHRGRPNFFVGLNFEYYEWRKFGWPAAGTDFWLPAFGVKADWQNFGLVGENLGPYGYGFKLGDGMWNNVTTARGFVRPTRRVAIYVTYSLEWRAHKVRIIEHRGSQKYESEHTEHDTGWFLGAGPAFSF